VLKRPGGMPVLRVGGKEGYAGTIMVIPSILTHSEHAPQALTTLVFEIISNARCFFSVKRANAASRR
jgi:hypothetical protein